jgi:hypothetical protein
MKKSFIVGGALVAVLGLTVWATAAQAASSNKFSFVARGIITDVDESNKTFKMDVTKVDGKRAKEDLEGKNVEFTVGSPVKVVKVAGGKDKAGTYHNFAIGQEVGVKGLAKQDDTYVISFARIEDRSFTVIGLLKEINHDNKTMKVLLHSSSYKPTWYKKGTEIIMVYTDDSVFRDKNGNIVFGDVSADDQRVQVKGKLVGTNTWQVNNLWNNYKGK